MAPGFNFAQIGDIVGQIMDTDFFDIWRQVPNIPGRVEVYSNIPCHIQMQSSDNPNPQTAEVAPIITSLKIHMATWVDVRNDDFIVAKKMTPTNQVMIVYRGVCGHPAVDQARQAIIIQMNASGDPNSPPTPPPPVTPVNIIINFWDMDDEEIKADVVQKVEEGSDILIEPAVISGYVHQESYLDGALLPTVNVQIINAQLPEHEIIFKYLESGTPMYLRVLVNGLFLQDNGVSAFGFHLFRKVDVEVLDQFGIGQYKLKIAENRLNHPEMGMINLANGTKAVIFPNQDWVRFDGNLLPVAGGFEVLTVPYTPTPQEENAYVTNWYDQ